MNNGASEVIITSSTRILGSNSPGEMVSPSN
jgi:hypothetical protein